MSNITGKDKATPMMAQWHQCKKLAKDAVLFFRMGDFYEAFYDDAVFIAKELDLTLTKRQEIPMAGVPVHTCDSYIDKLVARGNRVAIAEQVEDPKKAKGLVKRELVRVVTPGTVVNSSLVSDKANNFIASITRINEIFGLSFLDLTTGEFRVIEFDAEEEFLNELYRIHPSELVTSHKFNAKNAHLLERLRNSYNILITPLEDWRFDHQTALDYLTEHFKVHSLDGFGLKGMIAGINAAGALLNYLRDNLCQSIAHITHISPYSTTQYLSLDQMTQRNLELTESLQDGSRRNTLLAAIDRTKTPMGGRLISNWIKRPLLNTEAIAKRQEAIQAFLKSPAILEKVSHLLSDVRDLERLMMKVSANYAAPRDLVALCNSCKELPQIKETLTDISATLIEKENHGIEDLSAMTQLIAQTLVDDPPMRISDGNVIRKGVHEELDELRTIRSNNKTWIANYQTRLREETGIKTLKVGFNKMFGYYIEVSRVQSSKMPDSFQRRQTLVNNERYLSPELKDYEQKVLTAEERIAAIESELFQRLRTEVTQFAAKVLQTAQALANIDCLCGLTEVALNYDYRCPVVDNSKILDIKEGRHPVIEACNIGEKFIPNDTDLNDSDHRLLIITGPNMAGKSTYIRQVALLTIMAQMGSFLPAKSARIGYVDKIFTRIGASDDIAKGQSTFMVEMTETANILNNVTSRSLVILDEIGRGTSTYDGISIAWAVAEHLLLTPEKAARTLFATHYFELTQLEGNIPGAANYNVAVREYEDDIIFLRKIIKGGTDKSYGIHVGRLAGLPSVVVKRAKEILNSLEIGTGRAKSNLSPEATKKVFASKVKNNDQEIQLLLFEPSEPRPGRKYAPLFDALKDVDLDHTSPIEAHATLAKLKEQLDTIEGKAALS